MLAQAHPSTWHWRSFYQAFEKALKKAFKKAFKNCTTWLSSPMKDALEQSAEEIELYHHVHSFTSTEEILLMSAEEILLTTQDVMLHIARLIRRTTPTMANGLALSWCTRCCLNMILYASSIRLVSEHKSTIIGGQIGYVQPLWWNCCEDPERIWPRLGYRSLCEINSFLKFKSFSTLQRQTMQRSVRSLAAVIKIVGWSRCIGLLQIVFKPTVQT